MRNFAKYILSLSPQKTSNTLKPNTTMKTNTYTMPSTTVMGSSKVADDKVPDLRDVLRMIGIQEVTANVFSLPNKKKKD